VRRGSSRELGSRISLRGTDKPVKSVPQGINVYVLVRSKNVGFDNTITSVNTSPADHFVSKSGIAVWFGDGIMEFVPAQSFPAACNSAVLHDLKL